MDNKKSQIRDEIQRSFKKYQLRLKKDVETYSQELKDAESIYEKSRELVDELLIAKDEGEQEKIEIKMPLIIRLAGTNVEKGNKILKESKIDYIEASTLEEAANKAVKALKELGK